ncbi:glycoside hydrolase family 55 protein [Siccirubricoccus sp. KC 17139]|uniref:Glycoside hydrolase family 55 protein n=1 Tax=Siccirubricoccus soli TaxID=2899147 RepID=A0ABT1DBE9_9PROT|nr:glycoside hydrolase family 55 protein [Siccirubricoccus soli]MCO6419259.1 glycoside hydrolase family 55 protein [Siccirubricoccus soli]MCP2685394.1 glycoside hydrolase family 55 protein [Siccirubricoccus soli]
MPDARISELPAATALGDSDITPLVQASGSLSETRRATITQIRSAVLADRGAHVRDYGAKGDGVTNDAPAIQAAINDLKTKGGGTLHFGPKVYRIASAITVSDATIRFQGAGFTEGPGPGQGTWLQVSSTGFTPFTFTGVSARGAGVRDIAVRQSHTNPLNASWTPNAYDYVFRVEDCLGGVDFDNVFLCAINKGIYCRNSGRLDIRRLRGQVFTAGVEIDECYDVPRILNLHFWTFLTSNDNVVRWQQANGDAMIFRKVDGVFIDQAFALGYRSMFRFASSAAGNTTKFYIGQAYADFVKYAVLVEANGTDGQIGNLTSQGEVFNSGGTAITDANGICIAASNTRIQAANLRIDAVSDNAIAVGGSGNRLDIFSLRCVRFNAQNNGAAAISIADSGGSAPNTVYLGSPALLEAGNGGPLVNSGTNGLLATGTPAGRAARPGLMVGSPDTGLFLPSTGGLAGSAGGVEVLRATAAGAVTLGAMPGSHAFEVATPGSAANRVLVTGGTTGNAVSLQAQGVDANIGLALISKGTGALTASVPDGATSGGNARGANAVDWQSLRSTPAQAATGSSSVIGGGSFNTAGGTNSTVAGGSTNSVNSGAGWIPGGQQASTGTNIHRGAWSAGRFSTNGDAQAGEFVLRRQGADATAVRLTADNGNPSTTNTLNLPNNGTYLCRLMVLARQTGGSAGSAGDCAGWDVTALIKRGTNAAATTLIGGGTSIAPSHNDAAAAAWRLAIAADTANGGLAISGTGEANKTINWVARILSVEAVG